MFAGRIPSQECPTAICSISWTLPLCQGEQCLPRYCLGVWTTIKGQPRKIIMCWGHVGCFCVMIFYYTLAALGFQIDSTSCCRHTQVEWAGTRVEWEERLPENSTGEGESPGGRSLYCPCSTFTWRCYFEQIISTFYFPYIKWKMGEKSVKKNPKDKLLTEKKTKNQTDHF